MKHRASLALLLSLVALAGALLLSAVAPHEQAQADVATLQDVVNQLAEISQKLDQLIELTSKLPGIAKDLGDIAWEVRFGLDIDCECACDP
jgi:hypothetical protein